MVLTRNCLHPLAVLACSSARFSPIRLLSCQGSVSNLYKRLVTLLRVHFEPVGSPFERKRIAEEYQYLEHIVRMAKARAFLKLKEAHAE